MPAMKIDALRRYLLILRDLIREDVISADKEGNFVRHNRAEAKLEILDFAIALITDEGGSSDE